jgi:D-lactate dehydrogenase
MKITFCETGEWEMAYLKEKIQSHTMVFLQKGENVPSDTEILCNFVASPATAEVVAGLPQLKFVTTRSTGYDHIDLKACSARGIPVSNVPTYGENTVAEFTFALISALSRKIYPAIKRVREQGKFSVEGLQGMDLKGKIIGVIGTGHIGAYVIKIAKGFSMEVVAYDPYPNEKLAQEYGFGYVPLDQLLQSSDVITLHVPYIPATHHILNKENIKLCKRGSLLVNTARGGLVETEALVMALKDGILGGAGLDVLEEEGFVKEEIELLASSHPNEQQLKTVLADHELMQMENVLVTPHTAFNTKEAVIRILDTTVENILNFVGGTPKNIVKI